MSHRRAEIKIHSVTHADKDTYSASVLDKADCFLHCHKTTLLYTLIKNPEIVFRQKHY